MPLVKQTKRKIELVHTFHQTPSGYKMSRVLVYRDQD